MLPPDVLGYVVPVAEYGGVAARVAATVVPGLRHGGRVEADRSGKGAAGPIVLLEAVLAEGII